MPKGLIFGEPAKIKSIRLYSWEVKLVKEYIKNIRKQKRDELNKEILKNEHRTRNTKGKG